MAHLALYREWRPQSFADLVGQQHIVRTLKNALAQGRLSHAYLLAGPRGTGKTTVARLIAKAINCHDPKTGEPCGQCPACRSISNGQSMDIIEIDAASNRGIDDIRSLRDNVKFAPTELRHKVYIIDEVHMLTEPAFNALLKTLEEPPPHVAFVLATTEAHKIPVTIASRCQRYDFHRLTTREIIGRLELVCHKHGVTIAPEALAVLARQAEGGMRDALSLLDQVMAYAEPGQPIDLPDALAVLGAAPLDQFLALDSAVTGRDTGAALVLLDEVSLQGKDLRQFVRDYLAHLRDLLLVQVVADPSQLVDVPETALGPLREQAGRIGRQMLLELMRHLAALENELKSAVSPRLLVEIALIRLCAAPAPETAPVAEMRAEAAAPTPVRERPQPARRTAPSSGPPPTAKPAEPPAAATAKPTEPPAAAAAKPAEPSPAPAPKSAEPSQGIGGEPASDAGPLDLERVLQIWPKALDILGRRVKSTHALLRDARPVDLQGNKLYLQFEHEVWGDMVMRTHKATVEKALDYVGLRGVQIQIARGMPAPGGGEQRTDPAGDTSMAPGTLTNRLLNALGGEIDTKGDPR